MKYIAAIISVSDDNDMIDGSGIVICVRNGTDSLSQARAQKDIRKYACPFNVYGTPEEILARVKQITKNFQSITN